MAEFLSGMKRTVKCGDVTVDMVGQEVTVMGWTNRRRNLGSLVFFQIRDISGIVQAVIDSNKVSAELFEKAEQVNSNTQLYKQAGNSIVVNVLEAIFKEML